MKSNVYKIIFIPILLITLLLNSCGDESLLNIKGVEFSPESSWNVPIAYGTFTLDTLLSGQFVNSDEIIVRENGEMFYQQWWSNIYSMHLNEYVQPFQQVLSVEKQIALPAIELPAGFESEIAAILAALDLNGSSPIEIEGVEYVNRIKGRLDVEIQVENAPINAAVIVKLPTVKVNGKAFENTLEVAAFMPFVWRTPLADVEMTTDPATHELPYEIYLINRSTGVPITIPPNSEMKIRLNISNLSIQYVEALITPRIEEYKGMREKIDFTIFDNILDKFRLKDVAFQLYLNTQGMQVPFKVEPFLTAFGAAKNISLTPVTYNIDINSLEKPTTDSLLLGSNTNISDLLSLPPVNGYELAGKFSINPNRAICAFRDDASLSIDARLTVPFSFQLKGLEITDTIDVDLSGLNGLSADKNSSFQLNLKSAGLTLIAENNLPLTFELAKLQMLDKDLRPLSKGEIQVNGLIAGSKLDVNGYSLRNKEQSTMTIKLTDEQIKILSQCRALKFTAKVSDTTSSETFVKLRAKDNLSIKIVGNIN